MDRNSCKFVRKDAKKNWLHMALPIVTIYILLVSIAYTYLFFNAVSIVKESGDIWFVNILILSITIIFILASVQISVRLYIEYPPTRHQYEINLDSPPSLVGEILLDYLKFYSLKETPRYIIADIPYVGRVFYKKSQLNSIFTEEVKDEQVCKFIEDLENKVHSVLKNGYYTKMSEDILTGVKIVFGFLITFLAFIAYWHQEVIFLLIIVVGLFIISYPIIKISRCEICFPLYPQDFIIEFRACGGTVLKNGMIFRVLYHPKYGKMYMPKTKTRYTVVYTDIKDEQQVKDFISLILHSARK